MTPYNCDAESNLQFVPEGHEMAQGSERALGLVNFALCVHLDNEQMLPDSDLAKIEKWAAGVPIPTYAIGTERPSMGFAVTAYGQIHGHLRQRKCPSNTETKRPRL